MISVVELLQSLVRIPSVNPDGNPGVSPHGEKKVALAIQDFLAPFGFDIVLEDVEPDRPNLVARAPGPENRPRIMLAPHLDTVVPIVPPDAVDPPHWKAASTLHCQGSDRRRRDDIGRGVPHGSQGNCC